MIKSYSHCLFEAERRVFEQLELRLPDAEPVLYPNFDLFDDSLKTYLECDLIVIARSFCAVVELKNWRGAVTIAPTHWERSGRVVSDPHRSNNRKCKVLKSTLQKLLPHVKEIPFVQSIVVLTHPESEVEGVSRVYSEVGAWPVTAQVTFNGVEDLAAYLRRRTERDAKDRREVLKEQGLHKIVERFDVLHAQPKEDYYDQVPGYRVVRELEHSEVYSSYIAEKVPAFGGQRFRLRVFGELSNDPEKRAAQVRSLQELSDLPHHENILPAQLHPNERNLVVEVSEWTDLNTLADCLLQEGRIQWRTAAQIALGVARALDHLHSSSKMLVHRNVSPKSIILNGDHVPKLTDFDLVYDPDALHTVFPESRPLNPYQPPELLRKGIDFKSDVYSWGMVFYEMMAGEPLVGNYSRLPTGGILREHLAKLPQEVPVSVRDLLVDAVKVNVSERPEAGEVVARLEELLGIAKPSIVAPPPESSNTWRLLRKISEGATSQVYAGDSLGERAALKLFRPEVGRDRCVQERDMLRLVNSPYVPRYKGFIQWDDGRWCLIEEEVTGRRLRDLIVAGEFASFSSFEEVTRQLLYALQDIHPNEGLDKAGVIHNDINPNNILLDDATMRSTLIDFGAASQPGPITFRGTPGYICGDLLENGELDAQPAGDLYGLSVSLWEWVTGNRPEGEISLGEEQLIGLSSSKRAALNGWFTKGIGSGICSFSSAEEMLREFDTALSVQEPLPEPVPAGRYPEEKKETAVKAGDGDGGCNVESFVDYLNTIHNASASNRNALAESQAISPFFGTIYEPFPVVEEIHAILATRDPAPVVILTGHAGDGKSTIALDVLKRLRNIPLTDPLPAPPGEQEMAYAQSRPVTIVKDMSELPAEERRRIFSSAITDGASAWLIVSNTGPLLGTFDAYYDREGMDQRERQEKESALLKALDEPIETGLSGERHRLEIGDRTILVVNLTKLDNVEIAAAVLRKAIGHPAWKGCVTCQAMSRCHVATNVGALTGASDMAIDRVRWVYRRLASYEQRMTLRQMSAHLAYSLTAGASCQEIRSRVLGYATDNEAIAAMASSWFGEIFFGSRSAEASAREESIHAIRQIGRMDVGAETSPILERSIIEGRMRQWATLPAVIQPLLDFLLNKAHPPERYGIRLGVRRLLYLLASFDKSAVDFVSLFLRSPKLVDLDQWRIRRALTLSSAQKRELIRKTLNVLLEEYSGNSAGQYDARSNYLYVTLRRSDRQVFQATQLVLAKFEFARFDIEFDQRHLLPKLVYRSPRGEAGLLLTLPLLDFIIRRGAGDIEDGLDPIYLNQLEYFRAQLLSHDVEGDINLLRVGVDGQVDSYRYEYLRDNNFLELVE